MIVRIDVDSLQATAFFDYAGRKVRDARKPLRDVRDWVIIPAVTEQLDSEGDRGFYPWPDLSPKYEIRKDEDGYGDRPILEREGDMRRALLSKRAFIITRSELEYEPERANPEVDYAGWHQGGGYVAGRPPQRTIVDLIPEDEEEIEMIFEAWLDDLREAGGREPDVNVSFGVTDMIEILGL